MSALKIVHEAPSKISNSFQVLTEAEECHEVSEEFQEPVQSLNMLRRNRFCITKCNCCIATSSDSEDLIDHHRQVPKSLERVQKDGQLSDKEQKDQLLLEQRRVRIAARSSTRVSFTREAVKVEDVSSSCAPVSSKREISEGGTPVFTASAVLDGASFCGGGSSRADAILEFSGPVSSVAANLEDGTAFSSGAVCGEVAAFLVGGSRGGTNVEGARHVLEGVRVEESDLAPSLEIFCDIFNVESRGVKNMVELKSQVSNFVDDGVVDDEVVHEFRPPLRVLSKEQKKDFFLRKLPEEI